MQETLSTLRRSFRDGPRLPRSMAHLKQWLTDHHMTLMAIADTPHSIALGTAIGIFFGFTPLFSLKTLLSIAAAWVSRCNKIAAVIAVTLHDVLFFAMPAIYFAEYKVGCWVLGRPHSIRDPFERFRIAHFFHSHVFIRVIWPALIGSLFFAIPCAIAAYIVLRLLVRRARSGIEEGGSPRKIAAGAVEDPD
jgi:uncharacterized protein (DUF2062 family)